MLPDNKLSSRPIRGDIITKQNRDLFRVLDYELGGVALEDSSQGLDVQVWTAWLKGPRDVYIDAPNHNPSLLFSVNDAEQIALAFDQNMRWSVAYIKEGNLFLNWYDPVAQSRVTLLVCPARSCKMTLDDHSAARLAQSDVILGYLDQDKLYFRAQRERFLVAHELKSGLSDKLKLTAMGPSTQLRMQFELNP